MANRYAVATGNWSNTATWDGGTLPTSADDVYSNNFTVTIDQNVTVLSLRNSAGTGITAGGGFTVSGAYTITTTGTGILSNTVTSSTTPVLACTNNTGTTVTIVTTTVQATLTNGITMSGTGTLNITATAIRGANAQADRPGLQILAVATVTVTSDIYNGPNSASSNNGISVGAAATLTVTGSVYGNGGGSLAPGINVGNASANVTINGALYAGIVYALSSSALTRVTGPFISNTNGFVPVAGRMELSQLTNNYYRFKTSTGTSDFYSSDQLPGTPTVGNVRSGTVYGGGNLTGTLAVPNPAYVALGVATDNTVGSLAYNSDSAIADALWNKQTSAITTSGSIGERLKNAATVDSTGAQIAAYNV